MKAKNYSNYNSTLIVLCMKLSYQRESQTNITQNLYNFTLYDHKLFGSTLRASYLSLHDNAISFVLLSVSIGSFSSDYENDYEYKIHHFCAKLGAVCLRYSTKFVVVGLFT